MIEKTKNKEILANLKSAGVNVLDEDDAAHLAPEESRVNCKINSNSKGENISIHVYEGADENLVNQVVDLAVAGWKKAVLDVQAAKDEINGMQPKEEPASIE
jgi:hypothetical protein